MTTDNWAGVWMDQTNAFIFVRRHGHWDTTIVTSDLELAPHRSEIYDHMMVSYIHSVCQHLQDTSSIFIMGPGETKNNLCDALTFEDSSPLQPEIVVESVEEMSEREMKAKIMKHFGHPAIHLERPRFSNLSSTSVSGLH